MEHGDRDDTIWAHKAGVGGAPSRMRRSVSSFNRAPRHSKRDPTHAFTGTWDPSTSRRMRIGRPRARAGKSNKKWDKEARHRMQRPAHKKEGREKREKQREPGGRGDGGRSRSQNDSSSCDGRGAHD
jgi:hypothetical protein